MPRIIVKSKYLKPNSDRSGFAKYIATREGVDRIDDTNKLLPATVKQKRLIEQILGSFPDTAALFEYEDYCKNPTRENASEFISRAMEDNAEQILNRKTYADYIATRPRAERVGTHGLFTDDGIAVQLSHVSNEIKNHEGNIWTMVVSLRREDASRLGYDNGNRWRDFLRSHTQTIAANLKIPMSEMKWYAAFHQESHHPHAHIIVYSSNIQQGYLSKQGIDHIRSELARDIFSQDLMEIYQKQTEQRNILRNDSREIIRDIIEQINNGTFDNPTVEELLRKLSVRLNNTSGKMVYGYLKADVKAMIDSIVDELSKDDRIAKLYDLWYEQKFEVLKTYTDTMPGKLPLSQNKDFKTIKKAVIDEALKLNDDRLNFDDADMSDEVESLAAQDCINTDEELPEQQEYYSEQSNAHFENVSDVTEINQTGDFIHEHQYYAAWNDAYKEARLYLYGNDTTEPDFEIAFNLMLAEAQRENAFALYDVGRMFMDGIGRDKDQAAAQEWFTKAFEAFLCAEMQWEKNSYIQYRIGKMYALGYGTEQCYEKAAEWYVRAVNQKNPFAAYALGGLHYRGQGVDQDFYKAFSLYEMAADDFKRPNVFAQYELGKMFQQGIGTERDDSKSKSYFEKAFHGFVALEKETKDDKLQYRLGQMCLNGIGTEINFEKVREYFEKAVKLENANAMYGLGKLYLNMDFSGYNVQKGIENLMNAAQHDHDFAMYTLGKMYFNGDLVPQDIFYGLRWLEQAVQQDNSYAQYFLGHEYLHGVNIPRDISKSVDLLTKSAEQHNPYAKYLLGKMYLLGEDVPKNVDKAIKLLTASAEQDNEQAQYLLGKTYLQGILVPKDIPKAIELLTKAVDKKNPFAQYQLGKLFLNGMDVPKDIPAALHWLGLSAEQNNSYALYALGKLYLYGTDIEKNHEKAIACLTASAELGNPYAAQLLQHIQNNKHLSTAMGAFQLLQNIGRTFQNKLQDDRKGRIAIIERKLKYEIENKKYAHGLREG